jgi:hypothetical protein
MVESKAFARHPPNSKLVTDFHELLLLQIMLDMRRLADILVEPIRKPHLFAQLAANIVVMQRGIHIQGPEDISEASPDILLPTGASFRASGKVLLGNRETSMLPTPSERVS